MMRWRTTPSFAFGRDGTFWFGLAGFFTIDIRRAARPDFGADGIFVRFHLMPWFASDKKHLAAPISHDNLPVSRLLRQHGAVFKRAPGGDEE
jgi:hypothetical protein